jgi:hypothetical protein
MWSERRIEMEAGLGVTACSGFMVSSKTFIGGDCGRYQRAF